VSAVGRDFLSIAGSVLNLVLRDSNSPLAILSGRHDHPRLRHFLDDFGKGHFGGLLLGSSFRHKSHDFKSGEFSGQFGSSGLVVSAIQFRQEDFCKLIRRLLHETGLAPQYLELELTESLLLVNADVTLSVLQELKAMGLTLAIDDFGTGYSNFGCLKQFRVSKIKIDRLFIRDVATNPDDAAITTAIIAMAKSLHLKVIAEGVENEEQMSFLRKHHCDEIQGHYFSKPLAVDKVAVKLRGDSVEPHVRTQASGDRS
jgi:EAL domain-containing protein (putative c-di-GMP-specific phosphodiesterase class I)